MRWWMLLSSDEEITTFESSNTTVSLHYTIYNTYVLFEPNEFVKLFPKGFLVYSRKTCGADFARAVFDGRIKIAFADHETIYEPVGYFLKDAASQSSVGFSYRLTRVIEQDLPFVYKRKEDKYIKNMKKDIVSVIISGIDQVQWKNDNMAACLTKAAIGVLPHDDYPDSVTACVTTDRTFQ